MGINYRGFKAYNGFWWFQSVTSLRQLTFHVILSCCLRTLCFLVAMFCTQN